MERRKISTLGKYSLVVTLPKNWTKMNNLQGGDEVSIKIQGDGALLIHPELDFNGDQNTVVLPITHQEDVKMIQRKIIGCYLNGYDTIELHSDKNFTREQQDGIRSIVRSLYMRIYESHADRVTLQAFMDESLASVTSGVERMHIITSSMAKDVIKTIGTWDVGLAQSVISLEEDVDQFMFFLTRLLRTAVNNPSLASKLRISMSDCFDYHLLINRIEYTADHLTNTAEDLVELYEYRELVPDIFVDNFVEIATQTFQHFDQCVDLFFEKSLIDTGLVIDFADENEKIEEALEALPNTNEDEKQMGIICHAIMGHLKLIRNNMADIAQLNIDRHYGPS